MREQKYKIWTGSIMMQPKSLLVLHQETVNGLTIGQWEKQIYLEYTGLKDSNGKEIYEGDIIKTLMHIGIVRYEEQAAQYWITWKVGNTHRYMPFAVTYGSESHYHCGNMEIIGNIHENPGLLDS